MHRYQRHDAGLGDRGALGREHGRVRRSVARGAGKRHGRVPARHADETARHVDETVRQCVPMRRPPAERLARAPGARHRGSGMLAMLSGVDPHDTDAAALGLEDSDFAQDGSVVHGGEAWGSGALAQTGEPWDVGGEEDEGIPRRVAAAGRRRPSRGPAARSEATDDDPWAGYGILTPIDATRAAPSPVRRASREAWSDGSDDIGDADDAAYGSGDVPWDEGADASGVAGDAPWNADGGGAVGGAVGGAAEAPWNVEDGNGDAMGKPHRGFRGTARDVPAGPARTDGRREVRDAPRFEISQGACASIIFVLVVALCASLTLLVQQGNKLEAIAGEGSSWNGAASSGGSASGAVSATMGPSAGAAVDSGSQTPNAAGTATAAAPASSAAAQPALVNINTATSEQLQTIKGVGPATAQKIIDYRTRHGPYSSVDELLNVPGIGAKTLARIRGEVTV